MVCAEEEPYDENIDEEEILAEEQREIGVGIRIYSADSPRVKASIKTLVPDFIVQEINYRGEMVSLHPSKTSEMGISKNSPYVKFTVVKNKTSTFEAAATLARYLGVPMKTINWAGIKDTRAITAQEFTTKSLYWQRLERFEHDRITIGNFYPTKHPLQIGNLWGNHFNIKLRRLKRPLEDLKPIVEDWRTQILEKGFPNYYGMQRFGHYRPNSHMVGKNILSGNYKKALHYYLTEDYPYEPEPLRSVRKELYDTQDYAAALRQFPPHLNYERTLLFHLNEHPNDYKGAFLKLPYTFRNLLLSSYQSYLFNEAVSRRVEQGFSLTEPRPNDRICILFTPYGAPSKVWYTYGKEFTTALVDAMDKNRAHIVAPILGYEMNFGDLGSFEHIYREIMVKEDISFDLFKIREFDSFEFRGTFRSICTKVPTLEVEFNEDEDDEYIHLSFDLTKGSYATMLLRELVKQEEY